MQHEHWAGRGRGGRHRNLDRNDWSAQAGRGALHNGPLGDWRPGLAHTGSWLGPKYSQAAVGRAGQRYPQLSLWSNHNNPLSLYPTDVCRLCPNELLGEHGCIFPVRALCWSHQVMMIYPPVRRAGPSGRAGLTIVYVLVGTHLSSETFHRFSLMPTWLGEYECVHHLQATGYYNYPGHFWTQHICHSGQASGSPVPYFIYFEFYDPPKTIKVWAYFSDFKIGRIYFTFCLSSIKSVELDEDLDDQNI